MLSRPWLEAHLFLSPEDQFDSLMQQVADDYGLEVFVGLPQPAAASHAVAEEDNVFVAEDDLS